jgi:hypothetical protein
MGAGFRVKKNFFDRRAVVEAVGRAKAATLSKIGAFLRTRARSSIRKRKAVSPAGSPPSSHEGSLKNLLFFSYDPASRSVVVGPERFKSGDAPKLLEFGGDSVQRTRRGASRAVHYSPHPYMGPALKAELAAGTIPPAWRDSIRR